MRQTIPDAFIDAIPKADLHVHLDGSLRLSTLIELAQQRGVALPSYEDAGLRELVFKPKYESLPEYLAGFAYTCAVLQKLEDIERCAFELGEDNLAEGVRYVEVRFAPQLHVQASEEVLGVIRAVSDGMDRAAQAHNTSAAVREGADLPFKFGIIVCALRTFDGQMGPYYHRLTSVLPSAPKRELVSLASQEIARMAVIARDKLGLPVVGFDLAGEEAGYPATYHVDAYQYAQKHFLKKTVHAGEAYGPESIFHAITACHANRIGHGTFLFASEMIRSPGVVDCERYVEQLAEYIASERITIEVCLTSNLQTTPEIECIDSHPVSHMLAHNLAVAVCTDNRLVSHTTVTRELKLLSHHVPLTRYQFKNVAIAGIKGSFFPGSYNEKRAFVRRLSHRYEVLEEQYLPPANACPVE
jgi:adenosine deaminase